MGIVITIIIVTIVIFTFELRPQLKSRDKYRTFDFDNEPRFTSFNQEYNDPRLNDTNLVADPIALALRVAGYPNIDGINPDQVYIYYVSPTQLTVVIKSYGLMDDSLESKDTRVDLVKKDSEWEIEWAGGRWRCRWNFFSRLDNLTLPIVYLN